MKLKTDNLAYSVYVRHGDMCGLDPHGKTLGCASGFDSSDYVLVAKFTYLQEAIDYAQGAAKKGVRARLVGRVTKVPYISDYTPAEKQHLANGSTFVVWPDGNVGHLPSGHAPLP